MTVCRPDEALPISDMTTPSACRSRRRRDASIGHAIARENRSELRISITRGQIPAALQRVDHTFDCIRHRLT